AADELLGLGERAVGDRALAALEADLGALGARVQALAGQHDAGLDELLVEPGHRRELLGAGHPALLVAVVGGDQNHESHVLPPRGWSGFYPVVERAGPKSTRFLLGAGPPARTASSRTATHPSRAPTATPAAGVFAVRDAYGGQLRTPPSGTPPTPRPSPPSSPPFTAPSARGSRAFASEVVFSSRGPSQVPALRSNNAPRAVPR